MSLNFTSTSYWGSCSVDPPIGAAAPSTWASARSLLGSLDSFAALGVVVAAADGEAELAAGSVIRSARDSAAFGASAIFE